MSKVNKCKFKVGDIVIGKTYNYLMAGKGWVGKVMKVYDNGKFEARGNDGILGLTFNFVNLDPKDFDLYTKDQPTKIVITTDGKTTTAKMYRDKQLVEVQTTKCHPEDRFDFKVGARIAFDRLVGEKKEEPAKPKYYNGKVVCTDSQFFTYYTTGKVYEIVDGVLTDDDGDKHSGITSFEHWTKKSFSDWLEVVE